jgi:phosphatidylethanolamine-binding protein (PEBP) family uncharacterized protein
MRVGLTLFLGVITALLAGCGGGSGSSSSVSSAIPNSPAAVAAPASSSNVDAVAYVTKTPIPKVSYEHWLAVERAGGASTNASHRALSFLITSQWVVGEAAARKLSVSDAEVKQRFAQISKQSFPKTGSLQKFLAKSGETETDLLTRVKVELLESRIAAKVTAGKSGAQAKSALASFQRAFQEHWKKYTTCKSGYVMEDCSEYTSKVAEDLTASPAVHLPHAYTHTPASLEAEVPPPQTGAMSIDSPAFERNALIPAQYTCDGAGTSPPLQWHNVPKQTAALVLSVIDDTDSGKAGGIRWMVANISPSATGVNAGAVPSGAVVAANAQGNASYGAICPTHGTTSKIEFVLYALKKPLTGLSTGFLPAEAEQQYGSRKLLLGKPAITYAGYARH